jgi:hypothetical protein
MWLDFLLVSDLIDCQSAFNWRKECDTSQNDSKVQLASASRGQYFSHANLAGLIAKATADAAFIAARYL